MLLPKTCGKNGMSIDCNAMRRMHKFLFWSSASLTGNQTACGGWGSAIEFWSSANLTGN